MTEKKSLFFDFFKAISEGRISGNDDEAKKTLEEMQRALLAIAKGTNAKEVLNLAQASGKPKNSLEKALLAKKIHALREDGVTWDAIELIIEDELGVKIARTTLIDTYKNYGEIVKGDHIDVIVMKDG